MLTNFSYIHWIEEDVPYVDATTGEPMLDRVWVDHTVTREEAVKLIRAGEQSNLEVVYTYGGIRRPDLLASPYEWDGKKLIAIASPLQTEIMELPF